MTWRGARGTFILLIQRGNGLHLNQCLHSLSLFLRFWADLLTWGCKLLDSPSPFKSHWSCQVHQCIRTLSKGWDWSRSKALKPEARNFKAKKKSSMEADTLQLAFFSCSIPVSLLEFSSYICFVVCNVQSLYVLLYHTVDFWEKE